VGAAAAKYPHSVVFFNPDRTLFRNMPPHGHFIRWNGTSLTNCDGDTYAIVHQLDRYKKLWHSLGME